MCSVCMCVCVWCVCVWCVCMVCRWQRCCSGHWSSPMALWRVSQELDLHRGWGEREVCVCGCVCSVYHMCVACVVCVVCVCGV